MQIEKHVNAFNPAVAWKFGLKEGVLKPERLPNSRGGKLLERLEKALKSKASADYLIHLLEQALKLPLQDFTPFKERAYALRKKYHAGKVYLRAIIEFSNICINNCYYCGIRRDARVPRYTLSEEQVVFLSLQAKHQGYASVVLQSGERKDGNFIEAVTRLIKKIKEACGEDFRIVLSLGEYPREVYRTWRQAGADRYLLRIETSDPVLFSKIHPLEQKLQSRLQALYDLMSLGYQTGTGIMVGLPFQSYRSIASDLVFFYRGAFHMFGTGPYIPKEGTPLEKLFRKNYIFSEFTVGGIESSESVEPVGDIEVEKSFGTDKNIEAAGIEQSWERCWRRTSAELTLKVYALTRILLPLSNIATTTAMDALMFPGLFDDFLGKSPRLEAFFYGANVLMPDITPRDALRNYDLYEGKYTASVVRKPASLPEPFEPVYGDPGDPISYLRDFTENQ